MPKYIEAGTTAVHLPKQMIFLDKKNKPHLYPTLTPNNKIAVHYQHPAVITDYKNKGGFAIEVNNKDRKLIEYGAQKAKKEVKKSVKKAVKKAVENAVERAVENVAVVPKTRGRKKKTDTWYSSLSQEEQAVYKKTRGVAKAPYTKEQRIANLAKARLAKQAKKKSPAK